MFQFYCQESAAHSTTASRLTLMGVREFKHMLRHAKLLSKAGDPREVTADLIFMITARQWRSVGREERCAVAGTRVDALPC